MREPRTADVIEGVIDVEFNRNQHQCFNPSVSTSSLYNVATTTTTSSSASSLTLSKANTTTTTPPTTTSSLMASMVNGKMAQNLIAAAYGNLAASIASNAQGECSIAVPCVASTSTGGQYGGGGGSTTTAAATAALVTNIIDVMGTSSASCGLTGTTTTTTTNSTEQSPNRGPQNNDVATFQFSSASNISEFDCCSNNFK